MDERNMMHSKPTLHLKDLGAALAVAKAPNPPKGDAPKAPAEKTPEQFPPNPETRLLKRAVKEKLRLEFTFYNGETITAIPIAYWTYGIEIAGDTLVYKRDLKTMRLLPPPNDQTIARRASRCARTGAATQHRPDM
jgi:hypothetical protein